MIVHTATELGQQLQRSRKAQKVRQTDMAYMVGTSHVTIKNIEKGRTGVKSRFVLNMMEDLGLKVILMKKGSPNRNPLPDFSTLSNSIVQSRKSQGLRQEDLAAMIGVSHVVLSRMERGDDTVSIGSVLEAMHQLGLELDVTSA